MRGSMILAACMALLPAGATGAHGQGELARMIRTHGGIARDAGWFAEVLGGDRSHEVLLDVPVQLVVVR